MEKDCTWLREKDPPPLLENDCAGWREKDWVPPLEKESVAPPRRIPGSGGGPMRLRLRLGDEGFDEGFLGGGAGKESLVESLSPVAALAVLDHAEPFGCSLRRFRNSTCGPRGCAAVPIAVRSALHELRTTAKFACGLVRAGGESLP